jgi:hypothetical protein
MPLSAICFWEGGGGEDKFQTLETDKVFHCFRPKKADRVDF